MYLNPVKMESGAYPPPQSNPAGGLLYFPEEFLSEFYKEDKRFAGFVDIAQNGEKVLACVWNEAAYQAYADAHPKEPEPEEPTDDSSVWDELDAAYQEGVNSVE